MRNLSQISLVLLTYCLVSSALAADFSIPFVNASGLGTLYSDWATAASDASTTFTNPAGLTKLTHQQFVLAAVGLTGSSRFNGTATTPPFLFPGAIIQSGAATSRLNAFMPSFYYSLPLSRRFVFGFGVTTPFGLGSNYTKDSLVRYLSTRSKIVGIDASPSIGFKVNETISIGAGIDALHFAFILNNMYGPPFSMPDAELQNELSGWGYGYHAGLLHDNTQTHTRVGISYNSAIMVHTTGDSTVYPPGRELRYNDQKTDVKLPARIQFSIQQGFTSRWTGMATIFYNQWDVLPRVTLKKTMTPLGTLISINIPLNYHNTLDYAIGATFKATEKWLIRGGVLILNTPSNNRDRGVADPINNAIVLGMGAHYQQNLALGYDIGIAHSFVQQAPVNNINPVTALNGHINAQTSLLGAQITWNIV